MRDPDPAGRHTPPDAGGVLNDLNDFQRLTVEHVVARMYTDESPAHRMLVADEVGLGKTLIARGIVARVVERLWAEDERIDVVYICSNADIALQNIDRLRLPGLADFAMASRITLLPLRLHDLGRNRVNLVSLTPGTSFERGHQLGTVEERALLLALLERTWGDSPVGAHQLMRGWAGLPSFRRSLGAVRTTSIDDALAGAFADVLTHDDRGRFHELCSRFRWVGTDPPDADRAAQARFVSDLRSRLARVCIDALQPDLIILDEFQRFTHLLDGDEEAAQLARRLFDHADSRSRARVLLLSATPYKMYTLHDEADGEDHYRDFVRTVGFLLDDSERRAHLERLLSRYREGLYGLAEGIAPELAHARDELQGLLRSVTVRTERLEASTDRNGMLVEVPASLRLTEGDIDGYLALAAAAEAIGEPSALEYWKSAPYILNFMDGYLLKRRFRDALAAGGLDPATRALLERAAARLPWRDVERYKAIDPANARLRALLEDTVDRGLWRMLWMPPSLPYWRAEQPFDAEAAHGATKRLVFSSWQVVPKVIAAMLSYEAERRMMNPRGRRVRNTPEARRRRRGLLRFTVDRSGAGERLTGMPVLGLLYPSPELGRLADPVQSAADPPPASSLVSDVAARVRDRLADIGARFGGGGVGAPDAAWYWAAPILLDAQADRGATSDWLADPATPAAFDRVEGARDPHDGDHWPRHVRAAREVAEGHRLLGTMPDDLPDVVAQLALAGPGTVALRALARHAGGLSEMGETWLRDGAAFVAWGFRGLFNAPESTALLQGLYRARMPYWRQVLAYCRAGNLQAVLDEYLHVLNDLHGLRRRAPHERVERMAAAVHDGAAGRTSRLGVDVIDGARSDAAPLVGHQMRGRFARRLDRAETDDARLQTAAQLRDAFNSPFQPFVLATTSVGQEGLDFHPYCHAVVHWNLPRNPVDFEQREGRVHRFKNHAVRKNLAIRHPSAAAGRDHPDPWDALFAHGVAERPAGVNDLVPYWVFPARGDRREGENLAAIERHVPVLPFSREAEHLPRLRRSLAVYRMVFGQPRQEDLLEYLLAELGEERARECLAALRIDLSPRTN